MEAVTAFGVTGEASRGDRGEVAFSEGGQGGGTAGILSTGWAGLCGAVIVWSRGEGLPLEREIIEREEVRPNGFPSRSPLVGSFEDKEEEDKEEEEEEAEGWSESGPGELETVRGLL